MKRQVRPKPLCQHSLLGGITFSVEAFRSPRALGSFPVAPSTGITSGRPEQWDHFRSPRALGSLPVAQSTGITSGRPEHWDHQRWGPLCCRPDLLWAPLYEEPRLSVLPVPAACNEVANTVRTRVQYAACMREIY